MKQEKITPESFEKAIEGAPHGYEVTVGGKACWDLHQSALQQLLDEASEELPDDEAIKASCCTDETVEGIVSAKWMRSEAAKTVVKLKEDLIRHQNIDAKRSGELMRLKYELQQLREELARKDEALTYCHKRIAEAYSELNKPKTDKP